MINGRSQGLYILETSQLKKVNTLKVGMTKHLERRWSDYLAVFPKAYYLYCYKLPMNTPGEIRHLEALVLAKTKLSRNEDFQTEYRIIEVDELHKIRKLDISGRYLTELPPELDLLKNLFELIANSNHLTSLPKYLIEMPALRRLKLAGNEFEEFPSILIKPQLCGIRKVFLANNPIYDLPIEAKSILIHPLPYYNSWI